MNLGYVVNVIEDPAERVVVLTAAWELDDAHDEGEETLTLSSTS